MAALALATKAGEWIWGRIDMTPNNTVEAIFTVPYSNVALYASDANGNAFGSLLWTANCIENVQLKDSFVEKLTKPSGVKFKNTHHVDGDHFVTIPGLADFSFLPVRNTYFVLYVGFVQADRGPVPPQNSPKFRDRTYYGVTYMGMDASGRDMAGGAPMGQSLQFRAQFFLANTGIGALPGPAGYLSEPGVSEPSSTTFFETPSGILTGFNNSSSS